MDDEFQNWCDMWDAAQDMEEFNSPAGNDYDTAAEIANPIDDPERSLYARMIGMDTGEEEYACSEEGLLQESRKTPNPVYPDSVGQDCKAPKSAWVNEDLLKDLESLKNKLFKLENKMAELGVTKKVQQKPVEMKFGEKMSSQMEQIRKQIDRISDNLGIKDEPSPWRIDDESK